jgi:ADP-ribosylglycohydrolase
MLDHGELSAMAFALTFPEFRENNGGNPAAQWLLDFLIEAKSRRLCTKVNCTTCGAREFRNRLRAVTAQALVDSEPQALDQYYWTFLAKSLAEVNPDQRARARLIEGVRLIICDLRVRFFAAPGRRRLHKLLDGSWAGEVLASMEAHQEMIRLRRLEHQERLERLQERNERRSLEHAVRQHERIERKRTRDRQWREQGIVAGHHRGDLIGGPSALAALLLESISERGTFDRLDVLQRYLDWWAADGFDTGPVAAKVFDLAASGLDIRKAADLVDQQLDHMTAGCAPLHRNVVLASVPDADDDLLDQWVREEATLTHRHPLAVDSAVAAARVARALVMGGKWDATIEAVLAGSTDLAGEVIKAIENWEKPPVDRSGLSPVVLRAALHFVGTSHSFDACLQRSIKFSGEDNYVPILAGALAGARWGCRSR